MVKSGLIGLGGVALVFLGLAYPIFLIPGILVILYASYLRAKKIDDFLDRQ